VFAGLIGAVMSSIGSKNTQQVQFSVLKTLKTYSKVLGVFCTSARLEAALLNTIQVSVCCCSRVAWWQNFRVLLLHGGVVGGRAWLLVVAASSWCVWFTGRVPHGWRR
jgi:hypothetical protein